MILLIMASGLCLAGSIWAFLQHRHLYLSAKQVALSTGIVQEAKQASGSAFPPWMRQAMNVLQPIAQRLSGTEEQAKLKVLLHQAGSPFAMTVPDLLGFRMLTAVMGALLTGLFVSEPLWFLMGGVCSYMGVAWWLKGLASGREAQIRADLPDFLDAVSISLRAGVPLEHALRLVTGHFQGPLNEEFTRLLDEMKLGLPRAVALRRMIDRTSCRELELLALSLIQGLQLGVPLAETFMVQAKSLRSSRAQRAKQLAGKATPKITMISTLIVTPAVLGLIVGILVLNFMFNPDLIGFRGFMQ